VEQSSRQWWIRVAFLALGLFAAAFAISGVLIALPPPAAGGTCGPGTASEAPIVALLDPVTIGAGPEPAVTDSAARQNWLAFVGDCQSSADNRGLAALAILVLAVLVAVVGPMLAMGRKRQTPPPLVPTVWEGPWRP
jgi:hypothetical protein